MIQQNCRLFKNMDKLFIRKVIKDDEETVYQMICDLENAVINRANFDMVFQRNLVSDNITYFIAEFNGKPVGMVSCHIQPLLHHAALVSEIQEMFVEPEFRSHFIGRALIQHVTEFAQTNGAIQMEVTSRNIRERAHQFYQREGFEKSHVKLVRYF